MPSRVQLNREIRTQDLGLTIDLDSYTLPRGMQPAASSILYPQRDSFAFDLSFSPFASPPYYFFLLFISFLSFLPSSIYRFYFCNKSKRFFSFKEPSAFSTSSSSSSSSSFSSSSSITVYVSSVSSVDPRKLTRATFTPSPIAIVIQEKETGATISVR